MKAENIHPIKITFGIPVGPDKTVERFVYAYLLDGDRLSLIDTGVAEAETTISTALRDVGKKITDIQTVILTHSHPDHIGLASVIQRLSGAQVCAHPNERAWIEDTERQVRERPVPGFAELVTGSVAVNCSLTDGSLLSLGNDSTLRVIHTPGHSSGSISLLLEEDGILFSGDAIPQPGGMPIYDDVAAVADSLVRLAEIENLTTLYSSWDDPLYGQKAVDSIRAGMEYLVEIHAAVMKAASELKELDPMILCERCVRMLGLPSFAVNPLVARSFLAHKETTPQKSLGTIFGPFLSGRDNA